MERTLHAFLERCFHLCEHGTRARTEVLAGCTTFVTLSYILFVQPAVLSTTGMDFGAVLLATCLASALGSLLMAVLANYPIALAPAMGHNFYFAFTVCGVVGAGGFGYAWQTALAATFARASEITLTFAGSVPAFMITNSCTFAPLLVRFRVIGLPAGIVN